jgi:hypothetical protein
MIDGSTGHRKVHRQADMVDMEHPEEEEGEDMVPQVVAMVAIPPKEHQVDFIINRALHLVQILSKSIHYLNNVLIDENLGCGRSDIGTATVTICSSVLIVVLRRRCR